MVVSATILSIVAVLFLRNQIRPILSLADAADRFGRGRPAAPDFRIRGAREVRLAAQAFLEMRDRIERHVEQRTIMLAGVSHDLRTDPDPFPAATRDDAGPTCRGLKRDVDEMQQMLEDYMAFAKGDSGEKMRRVDVRRILEEMQAEAAGSGAPIKLEVRQDPIIVALRRNAFKRALMNLVSNASRYAEQIMIRALRSRGWLTITVEDNGPGIPADKREEVFRPFHSLRRRAESGQKKHGPRLGHRPRHHPRSWRRYHAWRKRARRAQGRDPHPRHALAGKELIAPLISFSNIDCSHSSLSSNGGNAPQAFDLATTQVDCSGGLS